MEKKNNPETVRNRAAETCTFSKCCIRGISKSNRSPDCARPGRSQGAGGPLSPLDLLSDGTNRGPCSPRGSELLPELLLHRTRRTFSSEAGSEPPAPVRRGAASCAQPQQMWKPDDAPGSCLPLISLSEEKHLLIRHADGAGGFPPPLAWHLPSSPPCHRSPALGGGAEAGGAVREMQGSAGGFKCSPCTHRSS